MYHYRSGPLNLSESTKYWIVALITYASSPNSNILTKAQPLRPLILVILPKTSFMLFERVERIFEKLWLCSKKCVVDSIARLQQHKGLMQLWKLWLNLCSLRWLRPSLNLVRSFNPNWIMNSINWALVRSTNF